MHDEKTLLKLRVYTESGEHLGKVLGFEFDNDSQSIIRFKIRTRGFAARIMKTPLLVSCEQVVRITDEKMIVEDGVEKEMEIEAARAIGLVENQLS